MGRCGEIDAYPESSKSFEYYIIPAKEMSQMIKEEHMFWLNLPGKKGQDHKDSDIRVVHLPPKKSLTGKDINTFLERWDLIDKKLKA